MKGFCAVTIFVTARKRDAIAISREEFFARNAAGAVDFATRKKFAPNAFIDVFKGLSRRKTRESVPSDSRRRHVCRPHVAAARGGFGSVSTRDEHAECSCVREDGGDTPLRSRCLLQRWSRSSVQRKGKTIRHAAST